MLDKLGNPDAVTLADVVARDGPRTSDFHRWLEDRKNRRIIPHRFEAAGYVPVRNEARDTGLWVIGGMRQVVYAKKNLSLKDQLKAVAELQRKAAEEEAKRKAAEEEAKRKAAEEEAKLKAEREAAKQRQEASGKKGVRF